MPAAWTKEIFNTYEILSQSLQSGQYKKFFFKLFAKHFKQKYSLNTKSKSQAVYEISVNIVLALQAIRLMWYPDSSLSEWESYRSIWKVLGYISYDSICAESGLMSYCRLTTFILLAIEFVFLLLLGFSTYTNKKLPYFVTFLPKIILFIFTIVGIIPSFMLLIVTLKYYIIGSTYIREYGIRIEPNEINEISTTLSIFSLILLCFILMSYEIFSCDMKHSHHKKNIKSRSSSELDLQIKLFYIILCTSYISFGSEHIILHQILMFLLSLCLAIKSIFILQYYNVVGNWIQSCNMMIIATALFIFLFGEVLDNSEIILIFNIILQPIVIYFTIKFVIYRHKILKESHEIPRNQFEFERKYRHLLIDKFREDKIETLNLFKKYWKMSQFKKNKIFAVWEFNFCNSIVKNERLARVKLSKIFKAKYSFEGDIQEWKIFNKLESKKCQQFSDVNFLEFLQEFRMIKFKDEKLCNTIVDLHNEFSLRKPNISKLMHLAIKAANKINKITEGYKKLIEIHKNIEAYEHYSSFLENIAGNIEEASLINKKKDGLNFYSQRNEYQSLENYGKTIGVMLISCSEESFGIISYINETGAQILKTSLINANGTPFTTFIPSPFDVLHGKSMKIFLQDCITTEICSHKSLFFKSNSGFLIECNIMIKLTTFHNNSYFLVSFKPVSSKRQIALLSPENIILNHSELFCYFINNPIKIASGKPLSDIAPYLNTNRMLNYEPLILNFFSKEIAFVHIQKTIRNTRFCYLLVINDEKEIKQWKLKEDENQLEFYEHSQNEAKNDQSNGFLSPKNVFSTNAPFSPKNFEKEAVLTTNKFPNIDCDKKIESQIENPSKLSSSRNSNSKGSNQAKRLLLQSKRKISVLQWVLFIMMISVIITMIAMLAYIISDVSRTSRMSSLGHLGNLLYYLEAATESIRTLDKASKNSIYTTAQMEGFALDFSNILDEIDIIRDSILADFELWTYCKASEIIDDQIVPLWNFDSGKPAIDYDNLYNFISRFIDTGKKVLGKVPLKQDFT
ncbi:unnamed protein product [Blepharisma stoltei]|uniref:TmcB/TmcC TPR repeats domain-containing protein n=1 Tax=Blepharisma stoltei TaxID=1481888 RepID=A0AAU9IZE9_9CILI|nr:unnamed protein product [Blepharisma stoltei]